MSESTDQNEARHEPVVQSDHHHQHHDHDLSHTDRNRAVWDKMASSYTSQHTQKKFGDLLNKITAFILSNISWIGIDFLDPSSTFEAPSKEAATRSVRVLDYACGPGTVTNALAGYASEFIGIDLSANMASEYNKRFASQPDAQPIKAEAFNANLLDPTGTPSSLDDPKFFDFDLAVVGLGFHHFENLQLSTQRLVDRLKPGGVFLIIDFLPHSHEDMKDSEAAHTVAHHGFGEEQVRKIFSDAGLDDVKIVAMKEQVLLRGTAWRTPFMARGRKALG